jgi:hypothetical protein
MSGLKRRIQAVEQKTAKLRSQPSQRPSPETPEEWLAYFEAMGREGTFDCEPDFPKALALYRDAVQDPKRTAFYWHEGVRRPVPEACRGQAYVRVNGAGEVLPEDVDVNEGLHRPVVNAAREGWNWLAGMALRALDGLPPVTEAEFHSLRDWLDNVMAKTDREAFSTESIELSAPRRRSYSTTPFNLWLNMRGDGPRGVNAGEQAEAVRRLQARYRDDSRQSTDAASTGDGSIG